VQQPHLSYFSLELNIFIEVNGRCEFLTQATTCFAWEKPQIIDTRKLRTGLNSVGTLVFYQTLKSILILETWKSTGRKIMTMPF
jgi:hypothetical protein